MSRNRTLWLALALFVAVLPELADAQRTLPVGGTFSSVEAIITRVINYLAGVIIFVASMMFTVGAFFVTFSRGDGDQLKRGKDLIIGAIIGMAVVLGSFSILRTIFYIIYG